MTPYRADQLGLGQHRRDEAVHAQAGATALTRILSFAHSIAKARHVDDRALLV